MSKPFTRVQAPAIEIAGRPRLKAEINRALRSLADQTNEAIASLVRPLLPGLGDWTTGQIVEIQIEAAEALGGVTQEIAVRHELGQVPTRWRLLNVKAQKDIYDDGFGGLPLTGGASFRIHPGTSAWTENMVYFFASSHSFLYYAHYEVLLIA